MKESKHSLATLLGHGYAHVQHLMDKGIEWGLGKMKQSERTMREERSGKREEKVLLKRTKRVVRSILGLVGTAGTAYYEKYSELKSRERSEPK